MGPLLPLLDDLLFLQGGGELGARIRQYDWAATPLGPPARWPRSLQAAVRIMLTCRQPMFVWWGRELLGLYNDACLPMMGGKHPAALGRPARVVWREIWDQIDPRVERAIRGDEGVSDESLLLLVDRGGEREEQYFTFSFSPVPDDFGGVGGILGACTDDTWRIIGERQLDLLGNLAAQMGAARSIEEACRSAADCLAAGSRDLPFAMLYRLDHRRQLASLAGASGIDAEHPAAPASASLVHPSVWPFEEVARTQRLQIVDDLSGLEGLPAGAWNEPPQKAAVAPIVPPGQSEVAAVLVTGLNPFRRFDDGYRQFLDRIVAKVATNIANAQAYERERQRAESLAELDRAKTDFFSNVSHEFRTPLTLMLGPLEDLLSLPEAQIRPEVHDVLRIVRGNGERLLKLVNALLDFSRIEAGRLSATFVATDLAAFTIDLASVFRSAVERAGLTLVIDCPPLSEPAYVDRDMWEKIVLNLLSNAFKYTLDGEIAVTLRESGGSAVLTVRDTGTGIPAQELPRLFNRFHRVADARGRTHEGTGIGLALVEELTRLHGGLVGVESVVGAGSDFTVSIPLGRAHLPPEHVGSPTTPLTSALAGAYVEEALRLLPEDDVIPASAAEGSTAGEAVIRGPTRGTIVLADDNADMRSYVRRLLREDYRVIPVADGRAAFDAVLDHEPDLVVTDVMMPNLDGFGLLAALRGDERTASIPVIMLSARAGENARIEGLEAGADDYVVKPFSARELQARVDGTLALAAARREALRREAELQAQTTEILESMNLAFVAFDRDFRFEYVNLEAELIYDLRRDELVGRTLWEAFPDTVGTRIETEYRRAMTDLVAVRFEYYYESWQRWLEFNAYPMQGERLGVYCRDITAQKRIQLTVAGQKQALERSVDGASLGVVLETLVQTAEAQSSNRMLASILLVREGCLRHGAAPSLPEEYNRLVDGTPIGIGKGSCGTAAVTGETVIVADIAVDPLWEEFRDAALAHGLRACWSIPIRSSQGEVLGTFGLYHGHPCSPAPSDLEMIGILAGTAGALIERDHVVGQRKRQEQELRDADRRKDEFLAMLAHELRNPLAPIRSGLDLLALSGTDPQIIHPMQEQVQHLVRLVDDLLDVSRIMRGRVELRREPIDLALAVARAVETVRPLIDAAEQCLTVVGSPEPAWVNGDRVRLSQVLSNLLNNASKYTDRGGHIALSVAADGDAAVVQVRDDGIGIDTELLPHVFNLFTQAERTMDRSQGGLGIGLTIVKSLVEMHEGTVRVESPGLHGGTTFTVRIPLIPRPQPTAESPADNAPCPPCRVLVVDDNAAAARMLARLLQKLGRHEILTAFDGPSALAAAEEHHPDLIILDIGLPRLDGHAVAERLRKNPRFAGTLIVALTGYGAESDRRKSLASGFDEHLVKPPGVNQLRQLLRHPKLQAGGPPLDGAGNGRAAPQTSQPG